MPSHPFELENPMPAIPDDLVEVIGDLLAYSLEDVGDFGSLCAREKRIVKTDATLQRLRASAPSPGWGSL